MVPPYNAERKQCVINMVEVLKLNKIECKCTKRKKYVINQQRHYKKRKVLSRENASWKGEVSTKTMSSIRDINIR